MARPGARGVSRAGISRTPLVIYSAPAEQARGAKENKQAMEARSALNQIIRCAQHQDPDITPAYDPSGIASEYVARPAQQEYVPPSDRGIDGAYEGCEYEFRVARRSLCGQDPEGRGASRSARRTTHHVRARDQSQDRDGARFDDPALAAAARGSGD